MLSIRFDSNESTRIVSLGVDSLYRKSICEILRKIASRVYTWWVENVVESTRIASSAVDSLYRKSICEILKYSFPGLYRVGLKILSIRLHSIESTRIASPAVESLCRKSICKGLRKYSLQGLYRVG